MRHHTAARRLIRHFFERKWPTKAEWLAFRNAYGFTPKEVQAFYNWRSANPWWTLHRPKMRELSDRPSDTRYPPNIAI